MRNNRLNYVAVGAFVVAMLVAGIGMAALLAGPSGATDEYHVMLDNVADIRFGTVVRYEGYPVGQVERVVPVPDGAAMRFRVEISVERGWRIPTDSVARIGSTNLLANKTVDIHGGASDAAIAIGEAVPGAAPADVFAAVSTVAAEIGDLNRNSIRPMIDQIAEVIGEVDRVVQRDLGQITGGVAAIADSADDRVPAILAALEDFSAELNVTLGTMQAMVTEENAGRVNRALRNVETAAAGFATIGTDLAETASQVDGLIGRVDAMIRASEGDVSDGLHDAAFILRSVAQSIDTINQDVEGTARNMNEFSRQIRQDPGALLDMPWRQEAGLPGDPR